MIAWSASWGSMVCSPEHSLDDLKTQLEACRRQHNSDSSINGRADSVEHARALFNHVDEQRVQREAMRRAMDTDSKGVCLIHGAFTLKENRNGRLIPVEDADGGPFELEYLGSGFLVDDRGVVLTNRHVAEPWWNNDAVAPLLARGLTPEITRMTVTFPGHSPFIVDPATVRTSSEGVDLALFVVNVDSVPVLDLFEGEVRELRGQRIMLLGFPTGLSAILARLEPEVAEEALSRAEDTAGLIRELSVRHAITPLPTHGTLNDVTESKLIYDAVTTSGGSGGPVFGPDGTVIGVNFAMMRGFQGSNFGVPIRYARLLIEQLDEK